VGWVADTSCGGWWRWGSSSTSHALPYRAIPTECSQDYLVDPGASTRREVKGTFLGPAMLVIDDGTTQL
jgi:hypothetical protein